MVSKYIVFIWWLSWEKTNTICILGLGKDLKRCLDIVGILMHLIVISVFCMCVLTISIIFLDCDPIHFLLKSISLAHAPGSVSSTLLLIFRFAFITPLFYAVARSISFGLILGLLFLEILLHCIEMSRKKVSRIWYSSFKTFQKQLNLYQSLNLIAFDVGVFSSPFAIAIMSVGLGLEIASVFAIIRLQALIEIAWPMYGSVIILAVVLPLTADAVLPKAIRIFDNTEAILRNWKLKMTLVRGDKRYYFKKIASLRPCSTYAGFGNTMLFPLRKSTKTTYYGLMIYYVTNTLISVPKSFTSGM
jgi:hypothetical protein